MKNSIIQLPVLEAEVLTSIPHMNMVNWKKMFFLCMAALATALLIAAIIPEAHSEAAIPRQVVESVEGIRANQKEMAPVKKNRDRLKAELAQAEKEVSKLASDNARLIGRIEAFGYGFDWSKLTAVSDPT